MDALTSPAGVASTATFVVDLDDPGADDPSAAGGKAAALARVRRADMATMPGAVITTAYSELVDAGGDQVDAVTDAVVAQVTALVAPDGAPLVVRSSSVVEDSRASSHAGQFESVLDVRGPDQLRAAIATVLDSRRRAGAADAPIAVLVQPMLQPEVAGVAFGIDPVTGRSDRRVVTAVRGTPDGLVGGEVDGSRWELDRSGHVCDADPRDGVQLSRSRLRAVADLGDQLGREFGCPQDVEWAIVDGGLVVLQSRPVTTEVRGEPRGPIFGPGPVAETFPEPLSTLEVDLWVPPLREGVRTALELVGAVGRRAIEASDLVVTIDGRVAIDLEVTGELHQPGSIGHRLATRGRRLRGAWRVGRLRAALPRLAADLSARADRDLEAVPPLEELSTRQLVALIGRGRSALRSLHAHEILLGLVADPGSSRFTGASVALRVLVEARADGLADDEIVRRAPVVLALVPPRLGARLDLPAASSAADLTYEPPEAAAAQVARESLRLRIRWMQEVVGQAASEVGDRLVRRGELADATLVRHLTLDDLSAIVARDACADRALVARRAAAHDRDPHEPLPPQFRVSDLGRPISVHPDGGAGGGTGAGGGIGRGPVTHDLSDPPPGSVLVVPTLSPEIGPHLDRLVGIVSETGSVLSHLAILAREYGVATVVGHADACRDLADGMLVTVDGQRGLVSSEDAS